MTESITHITHITIQKLWGYEHLNLDWHLNQDVNVLAGDNGSGKSTVLKLIYMTLADTLGNNHKFDPTLLPANEVGIVFNNHEHADFLKHKYSNTNEQKDKIDSLLKSISTKEKEKKYASHYGSTGVDFENSSSYVHAIPRAFKDVNLNLINTFDQDLKSQEAVQKLTNELVKTELDWQIYQLQEQYKDYQINIGKRAIEALTTGKNNIQHIDAPKKFFWDTIDQLFRVTSKKIDRQSNHIRFIKDQGEPHERIIEPYHLSSGEKQMLIILLTALVQDKQPAIMLMDEPEISLHTDWQETLIDNIRKLNENVQIIIATHSPSIIINGWQDKVFEISDLLQPQPT